MAVDERRRAEILCSSEIAELSASQLELMRETAQSVVTLLGEDPPLMRDVHMQLLNMLKMLRPLSGDDLRGYCTVDEDKPTGQ